MKDVGVIGFQEWSSFLDEPTGVKSRLKWPLTCAKAVMRQGIQGGKFSVFIVQMPAAPSNCGSTKAFRDLPPRGLGLALPSKRPWLPTANRVRRRMSGARRNCSGPPKPGEGWKRRLEPFLPRRNLTCLGEAMRRRMKAGEFSRNDLVVVGEHTRPRVW